MNTAESAPAPNPPLKIVGGWLHYESSGRIRLSSVLRYSCGYEKLSLTVTYSQYPIDLHFFDYPNGGCDKKAEAALAQLDAYFLTQP